MTSRLVLVALLATFYVITASGASAWQTVNPLVSSANRAVGTFKGKTIVAGGDTYLTIGVSSDLKTWSVVDIGVPTPSTDLPNTWKIVTDEVIGKIVIYNNDVWVTSTDGVNWVESSNAQYQNISYLVCGSGFCIGYNGNIFEEGDWYYSTDLKNFVKTNNFNAVSYIWAVGGVLYSSYNNNLISKLDAPSQSFKLFANVTEQLMPFQNVAIVGMANGPSNSFYLLGRNFIDKDAIFVTFLFQTSDWKTVEAVAEWEGNGVNFLYTNGAWVSYSNTQYNVSTNNGRTWKTNTCFAANPYNKLHCGVALSNNNFIAYGDNALLSVSADGNTWSASSSIGDMFVGITTGQNGVFYLFGQNYITGANVNVYTSTDGKTWSSALPIIPPANCTLAANPVSVSPINYYAGAKKWIANFFDNVNYISFPLWSDDLSTWSTPPFSTQSVIQSAVYAENTWVITVEIDFATGWAFKYSTNNGQNWTTHKVPLQGYSGQINVQYGNGIFVIAGPNFTYVSQDGSSWKSYPIPSGLTCNILSFIGDSNSGSFFCTLGYKGVPNMVTKDGINWTPLNITRFGNSNAVIYNGQSYIISGSGQYNPNVLVSPDGINWKSAPATSIYGLDYGFSNGKIGVMVNQLTSEIYTTPLTSSTKSSKIN